MDRLLHVCTQDGGNRWFISGRLAALAGSAKLGNDTMEVSLDNTSVAKARFFFAKAQHSGVELMKI